ncbi:hypothetical protein GV828_07665 [Flavobacterium sp. NST-5]|uniref:Uncharacterized protein n=1 Tax=Flavobacterium ichthyis TaxID=2698827 RepID=A0ABW9ZBB1_9FLAO|nr:hypothetical protein [Flavobacterium ichthyis]NBL65074.1 hypothetical protein [Flavobacterium ichthyis]
MKKILLFAAPLLMTFVSCSVDQMEIENANSLDYQYASYSIKYYDAPTIVFDLESTLTNQPATDLQNLHNAVKSVAFSHEGFINIAANGYNDSVGTAWANSLQNNPVSNINNLQRSSTFKVGLAELLGYDISNQYTSLPPIDEEEKQILNQCTQIYDTGDDDRRDKRTLSFAMGYEYSEANAIIMATLAGLLQ